MTKVRLLRPLNLATASSTGAAGLLLLSGALVGLLLLLPMQAEASSAEVMEDPDTGDISVSVVSSRPETTFSGVAWPKKTRWGHRSSLTQIFAAGEEFCVYTPVLGMRNLSCHAIASKFYDSDVDIELSDSEGRIIDTKRLTVIGTRPPFGHIRYEDIPRPDVMRFCARNLGSAKIIYMNVMLFKVSVMEEFFQSYINMTTSHNVSAESLIRLEARLSEMSSQFKEEVMSVVMQDYFRLRAIGKWVNGRGIAGSLAMLFCSFMSTLVIRRWFGEPRSSI